MNNYGKEYYDDYAHGGSYLDTPEITKTLQALGRWINNTVGKEFSRKRFLDVGCAFGVLVDTMYRLGWSAYGIDSSEYAIENALEHIKDRVYVLDAAKITEKLDEVFDVVSCIEVVEHMSETDAIKAIRSMVLLFPKYIVFSSDMNYDEPTHINVHSQNYWDNQFIECGYVPLLYRFNRIPWLRVYKKTDSYQEMAKLLDRMTRQLVYERDRFSCFLCGKNGVQVHEIVPKSAFGLSTMHICYSEKNRVCLCPEHHGPAHTIVMRRRLIELMQKRFNYVYDEQCFQKYKED